MLQLGKVFAESGFFKDGRQAAQCVVKIVAGHELGIGPMEAMRGIHVFDGQVTFHVHLMSKLIKRSRPRYDYRVKESTATRCEIEFFEDGKSVGTSVWTHDDAKRANLLGKDNWAKYPEDMLYARALSRGAKRFCAEVFNGPVYLPDELDADRDVVDVTPPPKQASPKPEERAGQPMAVVEVVAGPTDEEQQARNQGRERITRELKRLEVRRTADLRDVFQATLGQKDMVGVGAGDLEVLAEELEKLPGQDALKVFIADMYAGRGVKDAVGVGAGDDDSLGDYGPSEY
jgi:hypothetical protein